MNFEYKMLLQAIKSHNEREIIMEQKLKSILDLPDLSMDAKYTLLELFPLHSLLSWVLPSQIEKVLDKYELSIEKDFEILENSSCRTAYFIQAAPTNDRDYINDMKKAIVESKCTGFIALPSEHSEL